MLPRRPLLGALQEDNAMKRTWKRSIMIAVASPALFMGECVMEIQNAAITATADYINQVLDSAFIALLPFDDVNADQPL